VAARAVIAGPLSAHAGTRGSVRSSVISAAHPLLSRLDVTFLEPSSFVLLALAASLTLGCGGRVSARSADADAGNPGAVDSGGPETTPEASCPASYEDIPQGAAGANATCPVTACSYFGQFSCFCNDGAGWECIQANCLCSLGDGGCVNAACNSDADCPSGQHCAVNLGAPVRVCSAGCLDDAGSCPAGAECKMFAP
jgi:hypothetical protein